MTDIILHHYETSPYAEKVRLGLGLKGLVQRFHGTTPMERSHHSLHDSMLRR